MTEKTTLTEPTTLGLRLPKLPAKLSAANTKTAEAYYADCHDWESRLAKIHDRHEMLYRQAGGLTLDKIQETGAEIEEDMDQLAAERIELAWKRIAILPQLLPDFIVPKKRPREI